jgi:glycosidase
MRRSSFKFSIILLAGIFFASCKLSVPKEEVKKNYVINSEVVHPDWTESAVIYEVNIRQYTPEGTFSALSEHLQRLQELGVDILWLMPVHPIGEKNRKGTLGSYYSIKDYLAVNPEYGTLEDLKDLVKDAHALGMYVIIDWVANHSAWDNVWITQHPDWYKKDSLGNMVSPFDWTDVAQLDYNNTGLRQAMISAMKYWVKVADIDGFRCDVAGMVPCDFWESARVSLDSIKDVFMLAEDEAQQCLCKKAFDMNYAWELHHIMNQIAKGEMKVSDLAGYYHRMDSLYDPAIYRMNFITNHDENSWKGTEFERMGEATEAFALMCFTLPGMPLLYSGQEVGLNKRLPFFEKDSINWEENDWIRIYSDFIQLKKQNDVFWNGSSGGAMNVLELPENENVFAFERVNEESSFIVLVNLGDKKEKVRLTKKYNDMDLIDYFTQDVFEAGTDIELKAFTYKVLSEE